ncbi:MAG: hypothetical protein NTY81_03320 [Candidatus Staskawiczbacteria bacterium]|nr:hypothetical protein [Candidatus Staskawiczbacteria bacterium]
MQILKASDDEFQNWAIQEKLGLDYDLRMALLEELTASPRTALARIHDLLRSWVLEYSRVYRVEIETALDRDSLELADMIRERFAEELDAI